MLRRKIMGDRHRVQILQNERPNCTSQHNLSIWKPAAVDKLRIVDLLWSYRSASKVADDRCYSQMLFICQASSDLSSASFPWARKETPTLSSRLGLTRIAKQRRPLTNTSTTLRSTKTRSRKC